MYLLGYDVGSSSIKASLLDAASGDMIDSATSPKKEMEMGAPRPGWAEQDPEVWWHHVKAATDEIVSNAKINIEDVRAIGISYQMHGLVIIDQNQHVLRPSIIWCDSRAVETGEKAFQDIGQEICLKHLLNSPGNFTASKLKWVMDNEPEIYAKIYKAMLPGDYIAMKMTNQINTTPSGVSEGIFWDFPEQKLSDIIFDYYGISKDLIPDILPTFSVQGELTREAASELGLKPGVKVSYRAGDQPNNALSLNVFNPGEVAATAGTSGVVYGVGDQPNYDPKSRVNTFVHVNHTPDDPRYGVLMCINGTGSLNSWLKRNIAGKEMDYEQMNELASQSPVGANGLAVLPYGNGAERTLENRDIGCSFHGLNFNIHNKAHYFRAAQEGIVFAFNYGLKIMQQMGIEIETIRAGNTNMFLSPVFGEAFATVTNATVELYNTDGAQGAARGAGIGAGVFNDYKDAFAELQTTNVIEPNRSIFAAYQEAYEKWENILNMVMEQNE